jgi:hypothetical protein
MVRLVLVFLIIFLVVRLFVVYGSGETAGNKSPEPEDKNPKSRKGVPKGIGEYVDYEEVKKQ